ncbi:MAG: succinate dehydrogenase flavin-adding protein (antitoxin of CptAB toxin-antitoxin module) [Gammaproteobacteria bacterium]|jgi:succinate dehydrogenase flavin-adding protein (antitoxin of CptAB toxin-antitoxin module)
MRELDVLLNRFIDEAYAGLDSCGQDDFDDLLEQSDVDLLAWFTGREAPLDTKLAALVDRIRRIAPS